MLRTIMWLIVRFKGRKVLIAGNAGEIMQICKRMESVLSHFLIIVSETRGKGTLPYVRGD